MNNGIWKKICLSVAVAGLSILLPDPQLFSQDSFREFDRKLVATPAELYDALSALHPSKYRQQMDPQRLKEIEKAGQDFLSRLSPEQQDKAWELAEKYLRKNGVDAASSQKLMKEFGLPPEMQNELANQLRKFGDRRSNSDPSRGQESDDAISQLLRKARKDFEKADLSKKADGSRGAVPSNRAIGSDAPDDTATKQGGANESRPIPGPAGERPDGKREQTDPASSDRANSKPNGEQPESQIKSPFDLPGSDPGQSRSGESGDSANRDGRQGADSKRSGGDKNNGKPKTDLDQLLKQLKGMKERNQANRDNSQGKSPLDTDFDLETAIKDLAENRTRGESSNRSKKPEASSRELKNPFSLNGQPAAEEGGDAESGVESDKSMLGRAQDLISQAFNPKEKSKGNGRPDRSRNGSASNEKIASRFDRLLVKAVDRTLTSKNDQDGSNGVGGMLGKLIDRFQSQAEKKDDQESRTGNGQSRRKSDGRRNDPAVEDTRNDSIANNSSSRPNRDSSNANAPQPSSSAADTSSRGSSRIPDLVPDLSGINPTQVFSFFAIIGLILFVGYLLTHLVTGNEVASRKREIIKRVRNTKIRSPKDLVETVDVFLLAKFGIKSSWWNASLAQRVLHSGSSELQDRVDELFQNYVRARYMRNDIQIPEAEQQRYRKTLEELSMLDIKPDSKLALVPSMQPRVDASVSLEG